jgi:predicted nucleotidyltransferase
MIVPTPEQLSDLAQLRIITEQFVADATIIGATALQCFIDLPRFTNDIDLVVALDLGKFTEFVQALRVQGWNQGERREHRWRGPSGSIIDIVPAGPHLRAAREVLWPESEFTMSLVGFEHVFTRAVEVDLGGVLFGVAPPAVIALLKIVAYMDDQQRRRKDLEDLRVLFRKYEATSDRIFSDDVFAADLEDVEDASAFLLGTDIGAFAADDEPAIVRRFIDDLQLPAEEVAELDAHNWRERDTQRLQRQLQAFSAGFLQSRTQ